MSEPFDWSVCLREVPKLNGSPICDALDFGANVGVPVVVAGSGDDPRPRIARPGRERITDHHPVGMLAGARRLVVWLDGEAKQRYKAVMRRPRLRLGPLLFRGAPGADPEEAKRRFDELIKRILAPGLREMGFAGSGRSYRLAATTDFHAQVGVHRLGTYPDSIRFTLAFNLISAEHWENYRTQHARAGRRPRPTMHYGWGEWGCCWWARVDQFIGTIRISRGILTEGFMVSAREPIEPVGEEALTVVREYGLPFLLAQISDPIDPRNGQ